MTRKLFGLRKIPLRFTRTTIEFIFTRKDIRQCFRGSSRNPHHTGTRGNTHNFQFTLIRVTPERVDLLFCLILPFVPLSSKLLSKACSSTVAQFGPPSCVPLPTPHRIVACHHLHAYLTTLSTRLSDSTLTSTQPFFFCLSFRTPHLALHITVPSPSKLSLPQSESPFVFTMKQFCFTCFIREMWPSVLSIYQLLLHFVPGRFVQVTETLKFTLRDRYSPPLHRDTLFLATFNVPAQPTTVPQHSQVIRQPRASGVTDIPQPLA